MTMCMCDLTRWMEQN